MATLLVRGVDEALVLALKQRAARRGHTVEAELSEILSSVVRRPRKRNLAEVLAGVPNVGRDADFERVDDSVDGPRA